MKVRCKTLENKICALVLIGVGIVSIFLDGDATAFALFTIIGIGLFIAKENVIM